MAKKIAAIIAFSLLLPAVFLWGCDAKKYIVGTVEDNFGMPIRGAKIVAEGSNFAAVTDANGAFSLDYNPGEVRIIASAEAHTYETRTVAIPHRVRYRLDKIVLMAVPANDGLQVQDAKSYKLIAKMKFMRFKRVASAQQPNHSCFDLVTPSNTPICTGRQFVAFAPAPGKNNLVLVKPKDGLVWSVPASSDAGECAKGNPGVVTETTWTEMGPQVMITGKLGEGVYCLVETHPDPATSETLLDDSGACFKWVPEAARTPAK